MQLSNKFEIPVSADQAWPVLLDIERIAPCLPGAVIESVEGSDYKGRVHIKAGPVSVGYAGRLRLAEVDNDARSVVLDAEGREQKGSGTVKAKIQARLTPVGPNTSEVDIQTDLSITGKPAQMGRGLIADVSGKIIDIFAKNLAGQLASGDSAGTKVGNTRPQTQTVRDSATPLHAAPSAAAIEQLDMLALLRPHLVRVAAGVAAAVVITAVLRRLFSR